MKRLGSNIVPQKDVVNWHAKLNQIYNDLTRMNNLSEALNPTDIRQLADEIRADIDNLREKLPPVQLELPGDEATS